MYYTTMEYMKALYDRTARQMAFSAESKEDFYSWRESVRARMIDILGISKCQKAPLEPTVLSETHFTNFTRRVMTIQTEPGVYCIFDLFVPDEPNGAALLFPHGHGSARERYAGTDEEIEKRLNGEMDMTFPLIMVQKGYVVACPDTRGAGQRREKNAQVENPRINSHDELLKIGVSLGIAPIGWFVWDLMRLADYVLSLPEVSRLGAAGMSGGGHQSLYLAALDDRIQSVMISGYFYGFKNALLEQPENCPCNYAPHLYETVDMGDLGAMLAPRPFYIESGRKDPLSGDMGLANVYPQVEIAKSAYRLFNAEDRVIHSVHEGAHVWVAKDVPEFFDRTL